MDSHDMPLPLPSLRPLRSRPSSGRTLSPREDEEEGTLGELTTAVVQVFLSATGNDWNRPWTLGSVERSTGSGFVVDSSNRLIITNAHCAAFASTIQVRRQGDHDKFPAYLLAIANDVDIAILTVRDDKFWRNPVALSLGTMPRMQMEVDVVGFPVGGDSLSVTSGVVSRVDYITYSHSGEENLCVQVDAAINSGNSGGPALSNKLVVGVAFQGDPSAENIGYIVPAPLVSRVLEDFLDSVGRAATLLPSGGGASAVPSSASSSTSSSIAINGCTVTPPLPLGVRTAAFALRGFGEFSVDTQNAENPTLRSAGGLPDSCSGVMVRRVADVSSLQGVLHPFDFLTAINGNVIGNDGKIVMSNLFGLRKTPPMDFRVAYSLLLCGEEVDLQVYRKGAQLSIKARVEKEAALCPRKWWGATSYVMFAGCIFLPVSDFSSKYSSHFTSEWKASGKKYKVEGTQVVQCCNILPHSLTQGFEYADFKYRPLLLARSGGKEWEINRLVDVALAISEAQGPLIEFEFTQVCTSRV